MDKNIKCPRCGFEQTATENCRKCRINIPRYIELQKSRTASPRERIQSSRPREDKQPSADYTSEKRQNTHEKDQQTRSEGKIPSKPPDLQYHRDKSETKGKLSGIGDLFEKTWDIFKRRIGTLIVLYLLTVVLVLVPVGIFILIAYLISLTMPGTKDPLIIAGGVVGSIAGIIAGFWGFGSFISAIADETLSIKDALDKGGQKIWAFIWLYSLLGYIVPGGFLLFFVPGILFMIWFAFAQFILPNEDVRGMNAILKSKEYVKGYWFDIFLRLFIIWLASVGVGMIPLIGFILSILFVPFEMIFIYLIYEDLRSIKGDVSYISSSGEKFKWIGVATLGYIVIPIIILIFMGTALMHSLFILKETIPY